jgi:hypothetical protein
MNGRQPAFPAPCGCEQRDGALSMLKIETFRCFEGRLQGALPIHTAAYDSHCVQRSSTVVRKGELMTRLVHGFIRIWAI